MYSIDIYDRGLAKRCPEKWEPDNPEKFGTDEFVEFDSMINIRPRQQNMSRGVEDESIRRQIIDLVSQKVTA
ncbi:MAG: DUF5674 family protein [Candidatus Saccharimonadales bacterium]